MKGKNKEMLIYQAKNGAIELRGDFGMKIYGLHRLRLLSFLE
jgi:hypothetical protein